MTYVQISKQSSDTASSQTGKVSSSTVLNVRSGPGTNYARVSQLTPGTKVEIIEQTTVNGVRWGRMEKGWVCMQ